MNTPSLAERLVCVIDMRRQVEAATVSLGTPSRGPRFAINMAADEVINGALDALRVAHMTLDRLRQVAECTQTKLGDKRV